MNQKQRLYYIECFIRIIIVYLGFLLPQKIYKSLLIFIFEISFSLQLLLLPLHLQIIFYIV